MTFYSYTESPLGLIEIAGGDEGISAVSFREHQEYYHSAHPLLSACSLQLQEYFRNERRDFNILLNLTGTTFQKSVWQNLLQIPFGETSSYVEIAKRLGDEKSVRAVGHANGLNPVAIIVPCHRVIGKNGKLTGYAGGAWRKDWLLRHESKGMANKQQYLF